MRVKIIAEIGSNWWREDPKQHFNGITESVIQAREAGATGVKFQLFRAETLYRPESKNYNRVKELELDINCIPYIQDLAHKNDLDFWLTVFDPALVESVKDFVDGYKVASGDITYMPLLEKIAYTGKPVMVSTGGSYAEEVLRAINTLRPCCHLTLLNCVSNYPAEYMDYDLFNFPYSDHADEYGLSDHMLKKGLVQDSIALGYTVFEKHFHSTGTPRDLPDRSVSIGMKEFRDYSQVIKRKYDDRYRGEYHRVDKGERFYARRDSEGLRPNVE